MGQKAPPQSVFRTSSRDRQTALKGSLQGCPTTKSSQLQVFMQPISRLAPPRAPSSSDFPGPHRHRRPLRPSLRATAVTFISLTLIRVCAAFHTPSRGRIVQPSAVLHQAAAQLGEKDVDKDVDDHNAITAHVWKMPQAGRVSDLSLQDEVVASPGPGQVRVQIRAVGLNFADVFAAIGLYGATPKGPFVPGLEYSGTVESIGPGVTRVSVGERVYGFRRFGAYATYVVVPQEYVHAMPDGWTMAQGASFVVQGLTAWHGLVELGNTKKGHTVLVHSAAGGVGQLAMELCQKLGAFPIATIGSDAKVEFLLDRFKLRREQIIVRAPTAAEFGQQLDEALAACGRAAEGYDVVFDALGGIYFKEGYKRLSRGGRMITYGAATYMSPKDKADWFKIVPNYIRRPMVDPGDLCSENRGVLGFNLIWLTDKVDELNDELEAMLRYDWMAPHVGATFKFEQLPDGVRKLQSGQTVGKVVVLVDDDTAESQQKQDK